MPVGVPGQKSRQYGITVPLKWVQLNKDGSTNATVELLEYVQLAGVWLPQRIEVSFASDYVGDPRNSAGTMIWRVLPDEDGRPRIKVNSGLNREMCTVDFPSGTTVINEDTGEMWIVRDQAATLTEMADQLCPATGRGARGTASSPSALSAAVVVSLGLAGGCALRLLKAK